MHTPVSPVVIPAFDGSGRTSSGNAHLKRVLSDAKGSYELKNGGVRAATSSIIAILDADCSPASDWLGNALAAMKALPKVAVISGRTVYPAGRLTELILSLLSRSYVDRGVSGPTRFISNNNSIWRRDVYLKNLLPSGLGPFAGRMPECFWKDELHPS